jgi:hypothetical protein
VIELNSIYKMLMQRAGKPWPFFMDIFIFTFKKKRIFFSMRYRLLILPVLALLCSCASVSVKKSQLLTADPPKKAPARIFVKPPSFYDPGLRVDRSAANLEQFKYHLQEKFTRNLVKRLSRHVSPAQAVASTVPLPQGNFWLVTGRFDRVNQGSRLLRSVFGFGAGGTKLEMSVVVYDLSKTTPRPILLIETTGGSNATPGAIGSVTYLMTGVTALFSLGNLFEGTRTGITFDTIRTTREVAASLSEFLSNQGAPSPGGTLHPRRLHSDPAGRGVIPAAPDSSQI